MKKLSRYFPLDEIKVRFLFAGILNTFVGLTTFPFLYFALSSSKLHYLELLTISQPICIGFAFVTNKFLVFRTTGNYIPEFIKFISFNLFYFLINLLVLPLLVEFLGFTPVTGQVLFAIVAMVLSYFWHSQITFFKK
jgi:putative flippase GtrA